MGLCTPCDPGPAHPHHNHSHAARRRLCDNNSKRYQDHRHLRSGYHLKESKAVRMMNGLQRDRRPVLCCSRYVWKVMDTFSEPAHKFFLLLVDSQRLKTAFYLLDCICNYGITKPNWARGQYSSVNLMHADLSKQATMSLCFFLFLYLMATFVYLRQEIVETVKGSLTEQM